MPRWLTVLLVVVAALCLFGFGVLVGAGPGRSWALGNVAEWVTAAGLLVAGLGLIRETRQAHEARDATERAQAEAVTFYREPGQGETRLGPGHDAASGVFNLEERLTYVVVNGSALPVTDVEVLVMFPPTDTHEQAKRLRYGVVRGNEPGAQPPKDECWVDALADDWPKAWLGFTDSAGRRWSRPLDGQPRRSGQTEDDPTAWAEGLCDAPVLLCRVRPRPQG